MRQDMIVTHEVAEALMWSWYRQRYCADGYSETLAGACVRDQMQMLTVDKTREFLLHGGLRLKYLNGSYYLQEAIL